MTCSPTGLCTYWESVECRISYGEIDLSNMDVWREWGNPSYERSELELACNARGGGTSCSALGTPARMNLKVDLRDSLDVQWLRLRAHELKSRSSFMISLPKMVLQMGNV